MLERQHCRLAGAHLDSLSVRRRCHPDDPIFGEVEAGDEMPYVPRHQLRVNAAVEFAGASCYASLDFVSKMREQAGSGPLDQALTSDEQLSLDAGLGYELWLPFRTRLYLQARNLTDNVVLVSRRPYGARPNAPRWVQAGVRVDF